MRQCQRRGRLAYKAGLCLPLLTYAQFSSDCSAIELLGEAGIQPPAYASSVGTIDTLCPKGAGGDSLGFACALNAAHFVPGAHVAQWTLQSSLGGIATSPAYAFQTTLNMFPMALLSPSAALGRDTMEGRQVLASQNVGSPHPAGGCWGGNTAPRGSIATGSYNTCALQLDSALSCWGDKEAHSFLGELGPVVAIAASENHTCVVQADGRLACGGDNTYGQSSVPVGLGPVVAIVAGGWHTCILEAGGRLHCWGGNWFGQGEPPMGLGGAVAMAAAATTPAPYKITAPPITGGTTVTGRWTFLIQP